MFILFIYPIYWINLTTYIWNTCTFFYSFLLIWPCLLLHSLLFPLAQVLLESSDVASVISFDMMKNKWFFSFPKPHLVQLNKNVMQFFGAMLWFGIVAYGGYYFFNYSPAWSLHPCQHITLPTWLRWVQDSGKCFCRGWNFSNLIGGKVKLLQKLIHFLCKNMKMSV